MLIPAVCICIIAHSFPLHLPQLLADLRRLRATANDPFLDVTFIVEKKRVRAHRALLLARCPELAKLVADGRTEVEMKACRVGVLEMLLDCKYLCVCSFCSFVFIVCACM